MSIGQKIRDKRKEKGLTQKQLAKMVGVSIMTIQRYEKDVTTPKTKNLEKIAKALDTATSEFLLDSYEYAPGLRDLRKKYGIPVNKAASFIGIAPNYLENLEQTAFYPKDLIKDLYVTYDRLGYQSDVTTQKKINDNIHLLNSTGQNRLLEYSNDLIKIPEYHAKVENEKIDKAWDDLTIEDSTGDNAPNDDNNNASK